MKEAAALQNAVFVYARRGAPPRRSLDVASFSAQEGELFGLLGPNGSGKSTAFKVLSTWSTLDGGEARLFGKALPGAAAESRRKLGVVFQNPSLDGKLSVAENMRHQGHLYGLSGAALTKRIVELLSRFSLSDRSDDVVATLSGGLKRRVELAKALLHRPALLLLDEPSTGLDPVARRELWDELLALKKDGATILVATHMLDEAERCDRLVLLDRGRIAAEGAPAALKAEIGGDVVEVASDEPAKVAALLREKLGLDSATVDGLVRVEREKGHELIPKLVEALPGLTRSVSLAKPTLEDVFIHRTGRRFADPS